MKFIIILLCVFAALVKAQEVTYGEQILSRAYTCAAGDLGLKCNSCTDAVVCNGVIELGKAKCVSPNSYCDATTNTCTNVKPATCSSSSSFDCPEEGFYPDPIDCRTYYYCANSTEAAEVWQCPVNYVYDALNNNCKRKWWDWDCVTIKCVTPNTFVVHTVNANFYAYCDADLLATLFKCPKNMKFSGGCKFVCKFEGYYPGSTDSQYYHCANNWGQGWVVTVIDCPNGYEFNEKSKNCVKVA